MMSDHQNTSCDAGIEGVTAQDQLKALKDAVRSLLLWRGKTNLCGMPKRAMDNLAKVYDALYGEHEEHT